MDWWTEFTILGVITTVICIIFLFWWNRFLNRLQEKQRKKRLAEKYDQLVQDYFESRLKS
jgi:hypothetical protein